MDKTVILQLDAEIVTSICHKIDAIIVDHYNKRQQENTGEPSMLFVCEILNALAATSAAIIRASVDEDGTSTIASTFFISALNTALDGYRPDPRTETLQ